MNHFLRLTITLVLSLLMSTTTIAQKRSASFKGANRRPISATAVEKKSPTVQSATFTLAQRAKSKLHDASNLKSAPAMTPARVLGDGTTIYGSLIYSSNWSNTGADYAIYSFPASAYVAPTRVADQELDANGGGCYANGKYYYFSYIYTEEMGYTFATFCCYDFASGTTTKIIHSFMQETFDQSQITHDMTYDPTTDTFFAISYIKEVLVEGLLEKFYPAISTIDPESGMVTPIARVPEMIAIAANNSGELYGISKGSESVLYRINKTTGDCVEIGPTGLNPDYIQSATFDPVTDKLYWAAVMANGTTGLYEVSTSTGEASKICDFGANEEYAGLYIPTPSVADAAPGAVTDFAANFDGASLNGTISCKAPTADYSGNALSGTLTVKLYKNGAEILSQDVQPGATVSQNIDDITDSGVYGFAAVASNASGEGPRLGLSRFIGMDAPAAVGNLTLSADADGNAHITWTAPEKGRNDGYIDPAKLTYNVVRMPDNVAVATGISATEYTDAVDAATDNYSYIVTPLCDGITGLSAQTGSGVFGNGTSLPCKFSFDTKAEFNLFTVIDANKDFDAQYNWGGWMYGPDFKYTNNGDDGCAIYGYSPDNAADDWLITPPFAVEAGKHYRLTYTMWTRGDNERLTVTAGNRNTIEGQNVITPTATYNHKDKKDFVQEFSATTSGNYYVGFHITSDKKRYYLLIDDIRIDEVPDPSAPTAVTDLTATAGDAGAMSATISFTTPSLQNDGNALASLSAVKIFRGNDNNAIATFDNPAVGAPLQWVDNTPSQGFNTYRVVAYSTNGLAGEKAEARVFVGFDLPVAPTEVALTETDGHPVLSWTAPQTGINGGFIDPAQLVYRIIRNDGTVVSSNAKGTSFTDKALNGATKQYYLYYQIIPISAAGAGDYALSNHIVFGEPYSGDFIEEFSDQSVQNDPWVLERIKGRNQLWGLYSQGSSPVCYPINDNGLAVFSSTSGSIGDASRMISPKINLTSFDVPVFSFYFYHSLSEEAEYAGEPYNDRLVPELKLPSGEYVSIDTIYVDDLNAGTGWYQYAYDLSNFKQYDYVQLSFQGISDIEQDISIDLVQVTSMTPYDLSIYSFSGPTKVNAGKDATYSVTVENLGVHEASGYKVVLYRDGTAIQQSTATSALQTGQYASVEFTVPTTADDEGKTLKLWAAIEYELDQVADNNESAIFQTKVIAPLFPEVYKLSGVADNNGNVTLSWSEPNALRHNDDFEGYPAFLNDRIGDYKMEDGDGGYTFGFSDIYFEHSGDPCAFMTFNPAILGISQIVPEFAAHSGNQVLAAFAACDANGTAVQNDDWLISPLVHGGQTIKLYVKTANYEWGLEEFEVLYSATSDNTSAFKAIGGTRTAPQDWTEVSVELPAEARYFAIHCTSLDKFIFYVDDLTFVEKIAENQFNHTGYNIYRDGVIVGHTTAGTQQYIDAKLAAGTYRYRIAAVYDSDRESGLTEEVEIEVGNSGVESVTAKETVTVANHTIRVSGASDKAVVACNTAGQVIYNSIDGADTHTISVESGVYMVKVGSSVHKVIVK